MNIEIIESPKTADIGLYAVVGTEARNGKFYVACVDGSEDETNAVYMGFVGSYAEALNKARQFVTEEA